MHPAISPDGSELFFISTKSGSGGDIFHTRLSANGTWRSPENIGEMVNTSASEGFPFVDRVGRLYFASKGHAGYGGFDLFVTERDEIGNWKKPLNLGKPINSSLDDISFVLFRNGTSGAFSSTRDGGDDDIYFFKHKDSAYLFEKERVVESQKPEIKMEKSAETITETKPEMSIDAPTHIIAPPLQLDLCLALNYCTFFNLFENLHFLTDTVAFDSSFLKKNYVLEHVQFNEFDLAKDSITQSQLDSLISVLKNYNIKAQFYIHTATKGKEKDNLELSKKQGLRLIKYLSENGIPRERLRSKGMGESQPICEGKDCEPFGQNADDINARVEMKILAYDVKGN
jgi:outer membrane protein OmpA-like peptidoglycan-associated protein